MRYEDNVSKIPAVAIGSTTADELEALLNNQNSPQNSIPIVE
jgi:hypothetical protein